MADYKENLFAKNHFTLEMIEQFTKEIQTSLQKRQKYITIKRKLSKYVGKKDTFEPQKLEELIRQIDAYNKTGDESIKAELDNYKISQRIHIASQNIPKLEKQIALLNKNLITIFEYLTARKEVVIQNIEELKKVPGKKRAPKYISKNREKYAKISSKIEHQYSNLLRELDNIDKLLSCFDENFVKSVSKYLSERKPSYTIDEAYVNRLETLEEKKAYYEDLAEKISKVEVREKDKAPFPKNGSKKVRYFNKQDLPTFQKCFDEYERLDALIKEHEKQQEMEEQKRIEQEEKKKKEAAQKRTTFRIDLKKVSKLSLEEKTDYFTNIAKQILKEAQINPNYPEEVFVGKNKYYTVNIEDVNIFKLCFFKLQETLKQMIPKPSYTIDEAYVNRLETLEEKKAYYENLAEKIFKVEVREKDKAPFPKNGSKKVRYFNKQDLPTFQKCFDEYERLDALIKEQEKQQEMEEQKRISQEKEVKETNQIKILNLPIDFAYISTLTLKEKRDYFDHKISIILNEDVEDKVPTEIDGISWEINTKSKVLFEFYYKEYKKADELLKLEKNKELALDSYRFGFSNPSDAEYNNKFLDSLLNNICSKPIKNGNQRTHYKGNKCYKYDIKYSKLVESILAYYDICRNENKNIIRLKNAALIASAFAGLMCIGSSSYIGTITQTDLVKLEYNADINVEQSLSSTSPDALSSGNTFEVQVLEPTVSQNLDHINPKPEVENIDQELATLNTENITYSISQAETEVQPDKETMSISENSVSQNTGYTDFLSNKIEPTVSQDSILEQKDNLEESVSQDSIIEDSKETDKVENDFLQTSVSEDSISKNEILNDSVSNNSLNDNENNIIGGITSSITNTETLIGNDELFDQMIVDMEEILAEKRRQEAIDAERIEKYESYLQEYCYYFGLDSTIVIDLAAKVSNNYNDFSRVIDENYYDLSDPEKTCMYFTYLLYMKPENLKFRLENFGYKPENIKLENDANYVDHLAELVCKVYNMSLDQYKVVKATIRHEAGGNYDEMVNVAFCMKLRIDYPGYGYDPYSITVATGQFQSYFSGAYKPYLNGNYLNDPELNDEINKEIDMIFLGMLEPTHNFLEFRRAGNSEGIQLTKDGNKYRHPWNH